VIRFSNRLFVVLKTAAPMKPFRSSPADIQSGLLRFFLVPLSFVVSIRALARSLTRYLRGSPSAWRFRAADFRIDVRRLLSNLDEEMQGHVAVVLVTLVVWVSRARGGLWLAAGRLRRVACSMARPIDLLRCGAGVMRRATALISVRRSRRLCARWSLTSALAAATILAGVPLNSLAAVVTFDSDGNGANGLAEAGGMYTWNSGQATFYNGTIDVATTSADIARFGFGSTLGSPALINVGTQSISGLGFGATTDYGYSLTNTVGSTLTIGTGGITIDAGARPTNIGSGTLSLVLSGAQSWTNNSVSLVTYGGAIDNGGLLLTVNNTSTGDQLLYGNLTGAGGLTINGSGTGITILSGSNTGFTGATNVATGTLRLGSANALGTAGGATTVSSGAVLDLGGFGIADPISIVGSGIGGTGALVNSGSGLSRVTGAVTLTGPTTIGGAGQMTFATAAIGESGGSGHLLIKTGTGVTTISGLAGTRTGATRIDAGVLRLFGAANVNPLGTGAGAIILNGGSLSLMAAVASSLTQNVQLNTASNTIMTDSSAAAGVYTLGTLTFNAGATGLTLTPGLLQATNIATGATFGATTISGNTTFTVNNAGVGISTLTLGQIVDGGTARTITKEGAGVLTFATASTLAAGSALAVNRGTVNLNAAILGTSAAVSVNNFALLNVAASQSAASLSGLGRVTIASGQTLTVGAGGASSTFGGLLTLTGGLTKTGTGTLLLNGPNTGVGTGGSTLGIVVNGGTLQVENLLTALGTARVTLNGVGTKLDLRANTTQSFANLITIGSATTINVQSTGGTTANNVLTL